MLLPENRIRAGTGAPFARRQEQHHILYGARNDDITANKRQQPYHISVEHTAPHRRAGPSRTTTGPTPQGGEGTRHVTMTLLLTSGSNHTIPLQNTPTSPQAPLHRGGGDEETGKATRPNQTTTHLAGKGGYHGVGGCRGGVAALHHI